MGEVQSNQVSLDVLKGIGKGALNYLKEIYNKGVSQQTPENKQAAADKAYTPITAPQDQSISLGGLLLGGVGSSCGDTYTPPVTETAKCDREKLDALPWEWVAEQYIIEKELITPEDIQDLKNIGKYETLLKEIGEIFKKANDDEVAPYKEEVTMHDRIENCGEGWKYVGGKVLGALYRIVTLNIHSAVDNDYDLYSEHDAIKDVVDKYISPPVEPPPPPLPEVKVESVETNPSLVRVGKPFTITLTGKNLDQAEYIILTNIKEPSFGIAKQQEQRVIFEKVTAKEEGEVKGKLWISKADKEAGREPEATFTIEILPPAGIIIVPNKLKIAKKKLASAIGQLKDVLATAKNDCPELVPTLENAVGNAGKSYKSNNLGKIKRHTKLLNRDKTKTGSIAYHDKKVKDCIKEKADAVAKAAGLKKAEKLLLASRGGLKSAIGDLMNIKLNNCPEALKGELRNAIKTAEAIGGRNDRGAINARKDLLNSKRKGSIAYFKNKVKAECKKKEKVPPITTTSVDPKCEGASRKKAARSIKACREEALKYCGGLTPDNAAGCRTDLLENKYSIDKLIKDW